MLAGLFVPACLGVVAGFFVVLLTSEYPEAIRDFLVSAYRYALRVEAYVGLRPAFGLPRGSGAVPDGALVCAELDDRHGSGASQEIANTTSRRVALAAQGSYVKQTVVAMLLGSLRRW